MRLFAIAAACVAALSMAGCQSSKLASFFGTSDPCAQAELGYAAFVTVAANTKKVTPAMKKYAATGIAVIREQCSDGNISKFDLAKTVRAYVAGINALK